MAYPTSEYSAQAKPKPVAAAPAVDYEALLAADPALQAALARANAEGVADQGALTEQRRAALIQYGAVPTDLPESMVGSIAPDINDTTRELANANTQAGLSTVAQLGQAYRRQRGGDIASLAGRGLLRSGAYRQHNREDLQAFQQNQANAAQSLLGTLAGYWGTYGQNQAAHAADVGQATSDALSRVVGQINAGELAPSVSLAAPAAAKPRPAPVTASALPSMLKPPGAARRASRAGANMRRFY